MEFEMKRLLAMMAGGMIGGMAGHLGTLMLTNGVTKTRIVLVVLTLLAATFFIWIASRKSE
jgi:hypothetical protein